LLQGLQIERSDVDPSCHALDLLQRLADEPIEQLLMRGQTDAWVIALICQAK
jgi:hypothetical protein